MIDARLNSYSAYVFGYGSLVDIPALSDFLGRRLRAGEDYLVTTLNGYRRVWNVARKNDTRPGYKYYVDPHTNARPEIYITYLNVEPDAHTKLYGVLFGVDDDELALVDRRERNYARHDVSSSVVEPLLGPVWLYTGLPEAINRYEAGLRAGNIVIPQSYYDLVGQAFATLGEAPLRNYQESTVPTSIPRRALRLVRT